MIDLKEIIDALDKNRKEICPEIPLDVILKILRVEQSNMTGDRNDAISEINKILNEFFEANLNA